MSVAMPIDTGVTLRPVDLAAGMVVVRHFGFAHTVAACSCGWKGKRRYLKAAAEQDAWMHSIQRHCAIAVPLVRPALTARTG